MKKILLMLSITTSLLLSTSVTRAETVYLTSLAWQPYAGAELASQGASVAVAKAAFEAMGHKLVVEFFPWSRAVSLATNDEKYQGYFPEYFYESDEFLFSNPMGVGPLGFVENSSKPISWSSMDDLKNYSIGVVQDYVNTEELDAMIANGSIKSQSVVSDAQNVLKVSAGRIDMAVIDSNVLDYLLKNDPKLSPAVGKVKMNDKLLVDKELFVAFKNTPNGNRWKDVFNEGLTKIDIDAIMAQHM
ncbi:ABC transporter substrate-binding protein [Reinekea sp. G2M2-21]|uniref:substrate-binding periplasmic protein n=1 Tax=Reinekea sp. G2M2-21 TaxID=2788942 RepID=UPI001E2C5C8B|nr:transporter substrate-binding domain-containing protein [Reinekea sp. G2M2-21]